jgi:hypothetical protein
MICESAVRLRCFILKRVTRVTRLPEQRLRNYQVLRGRALKRHFACPSTGSGFRQHGTSHFICCSFFALRAKNEQQKEDKVPL